MGDMGKGTEDVQPPVDVDVARRRRHAKDGSTLSVYLPPEADWDLKEEFLNRLCGLVEEVFAERGNWDPFVVGHAGDVLHIDRDDHVYLSTSCWHDEHTYCQSNTGMCGHKKPGECKFCSARCICPCHAKTPAQQGPAKTEEEDEDDVRSTPDQAAQAAAA